MINIFGKKNTGIKNIKKINSLYSQFFLRSPRSPRKVGAGRGRLSVFFLLSIFSSCLKEETPVPLPKPGNMETVQIKIGFPYLNQVYYDCETNTVVKTNTKYDWDLSFECSPTGNHVLLNTATGMLAANKGNVLFSSVTSVSGVTWLWDNPNGNLDSTAIGNWQNTNNIYK